MRRLAAVTAAATALVLATAGLAPAGTSAADLVAKPILTGLPFPAAFTFFSDGRLIYGERYTGRIMLFDPSTGTKTVLFTVTDVDSSGAQGLLGLAVDPRWPKKPFVYAYATRNIGGQLQNQILKITVAGDHGTAFKVIFVSDSKTGNNHVGGHIAFGPDNKLYVVVGDSQVPANAQDLSNDAGKVLRMTRAGKAPADNPFTGSLIFAYGLRNSFGFTFDPQTGLLWETENGPLCNDEINLERSGENHAWGPNETCSGTAPQNTNQDGPEPRILPAAFFGTPTIAPTGAVFCNRCALTNAKGNLFFASYKTGYIREVRLTSDRTAISSMFVAYRFADAVLSMQRAPGGAIYFSSPTGIFELLQA